MARHTVADWNILPEETQLELSRQALQHAVQHIVGKAELLAEEMEHGRLHDAGGPDALRLLARVMRATGDDDFAVAGHA